LNKNHKKVKISTTSNVKKTVQPVAQPVEQLKWVKPRSYPGTLLALSAEIRREDERSFMKDGSVIDLVSRKEKSIAEYEEFAKLYESFRTYECLDDTEKGRMVALAEKLFNNESYLGLRSLAHNGIRGYADRRWLSRTGVGLSNFISDVRNGYPSGTTDRIYGSFDASDASFSRKRKKEFEETARKAAWDDVVKYGKDKALKLFEEKRKEYEPAIRYKAIEFYDKIYAKALKKPVGFPQ